MKQIKITPQKVRVKGNLIPEYDTLEEKTNYEDYHVSHQKLQNYTYQGVTKKVIRLTPKGDPLYLALTVDNTSILPGRTSNITCRAYYKEDNVTYNLKGQTVYIYDNDSLYSTLVTDNNGEVHLAFTTNVEGTHNLKFQTVYSNGYDPASKTQKIHVYKTTKMTVNTNSIKLAHDEKTTIIWKLTDKNNKALVGKPLNIYEGIRKLATKNTDKNGEVKYSYLESTNRGVETVLTKDGTISLVQNRTCQMNGYLKDKNGNPLANKRVYLYVHLSAYSQASAVTDSTGHFTIEYLPKYFNEYEYFFVFHSTVDDTENNQYVHYEPTMLSLGKIKPKRAPEIELMGQDGITVGGTVKFTGKIYDTDREYNFAGQKLELWMTPYTGTTTTIANLTIDDNNQVSFNYQINNVDEYEFLLVYTGDEEYLSTTSQTFIVNVWAKSLKMTTTIPNRNICVIQDYFPITTTVTDSNNNKLKNIVLKYYLDSEDETLIGTATTNNNGVATFTGFKGMNTYSGVQATIGSHVIIVKHEQDSTYEEKKTIHSISVVKRTRDLEITSPNVASSKSAQLVTQDLSDANWTLYDASLNKTNLGGTGYGTFYTREGYLCAYTAVPFTIRDKLEIKFSFISCNYPYEIGFIRQNGNKCVRGVIIDADEYSLDYGGDPPTYTLKVENGELYILDIDGNEMDTYHDGSMESISGSHLNQWYFYILTYTNTVGLDYIKVRMQTPYKVEGTLTYKESVSANVYNTNNHNVEIETSGLTEQPLLQEDWYQIEYALLLNNITGVKNFDLSSFTSANAQSGATDHSIKADGSLILGNKKYLYYDLDSSKNFSMIVDINCTINTGSFEVGIMRNDGTQNYYKLFENSSGASFKYLDTVTGNQTTEQSTTTDSFERKNASPTQYRYNNRLMIHKTGDEIKFTYYNRYNGSTISITKPYTHTSGSTLKFFALSTGANIVLTTFNVYEYTGTVPNETGSTKLNYHINSPTRLEKTNDTIQPGSREIALYKYPVTITNNTDTTFEIVTNEPDTSNSYIQICTLKDNLSYNDRNYVKLDPITGNTRRLRITFKKLQLTVSDLSNNTTILSRTLPVNSKQYVGFYNTHKGAFQITKMYNTMEAITQYPMLELTNWEFTENLTRNTNDTLSLDAYVTSNNYLFPGIRRDALLVGRPINANKDSFVLIKAYQKGLSPRVGIARRNGNDLTIFYKSLSAVESYSTWGTHEYVFRRVPGTTKMDILIDGKNLGNEGVNYGNTQLYIFLYNTQYAFYIEEIALRQDTIRAITTQGDWGTPIVPYGEGTYHFKATAIEDNWYNASVKEINVISSNKDVPEIEIDDDVVKKPSRTLIFHVTNDTTGYYSIRVYNENDGTNELVATRLTHNNGTVQKSVNFSSYADGHYLYALEYEGDSKYIAISSEKKKLDIGSGFVITNNEQVGGIITAEIGSVVYLTGSVTDPFGDPVLNDILTIFVDDEEYKEIPITSGTYGGFMANHQMYNSINLADLGLTAGEHTIKLTMSNTSIFPYPVCNITLNVINKQVDIVGHPVSMKKGGSATWSVTLPSDFDGTLYVYSVNSDGSYITGTAGTSIISSIASDNSSLTRTTVDEDTVKVSWADRWNGTNTTVVNNVRNTAGEHYILYKLYNDSFYRETTSKTVIFTRVPAQITTEDVRGFENEDRKINVRCIDTLGVPYNGSLNVYIDGTKTGTITCNSNGMGTYTLPKAKRTYERNDAHITDVKFEYVFTESGYWSDLNADANSTSYNINTNSYGIFINKVDAVTLSHVQTWKTMGITDLYVRKNTESDSTKLDDVLNLLNTNNLRSYFRVHAVFNCNSNVSAAENEPRWYTDTGTATGHLLPSRITDLQNHITAMLNKGVDGICFDYIRFASSSTYEHFEPEITDEITQLVNFIKNRTKNKTIIISACTNPEIDNVKENYGQNYEVFERLCDYVIPMIYVYDYSNFNIQTPVNSNGIMWQQTVLHKIYQQSLEYADGINNKNNKVMPCITSYKGDKHEDEHLTTQEFVTQILSMWNYGIERGYTQQSMVFFRHNLFTQNPPRYDYMVSKTNTAFQIELEPVIKITSINRSSGKLQILWRTQWGGYPSNAGQAYIKIDGEVVTKNGSVYYHNIDNSGSVTMDIDLTKYSLGSHTVQIVFEGNVEKHLKEGTWNRTITLT